jgi:hypothetical protein
VYCRAGLLLAFLSGAIWSLPAQAEEAQSDDATLAEGSAGSANLHTPNQRTPAAPGFYPVLLIFGENCRRFDPIHARRLEALVAVFMFAIRK